MEVRCRSVENGSQVRTDRTHRLSAKRVDATTSAGTSPPELLACLEVVYDLIMTGKCRQKSRFRNDISAEIKCEAIKAEECNQGRQIKVKTDKVFCAILP